MKTESIFQKMTFKTIFFMGGCKMYQTTYPCCTKTVALGTNPNQKEVWHGCLNIFGMGVTRNFFQGGRASTHQPLLRDTHDL